MARNTVFDQVIRPLASSYTAFGQFIPPAVCGILQPMAVAVCAVGEAETPEQKAALVRVDHMEDRVNPYQNKKKYLYICIYVYVRCSLYFVNVFNGFMGMGPCAQGPIHIH